MKIFYNGNIVTLKSENDTAQAVLVEDGLIKAVGTNDEILAMKNDSAELIDLEGKTMTPGFIDPHSHFGAVCTTSIYPSITPPPLGKVNNIDKMIETIKEGVKGKVMTGIMAVGYDHEQLEEGRHPSKEELDKVSTEIPVLAVHASLHVGSMNTYALEKFGIMDLKEDPEGSYIQRDENGVPTGYVEERLFQGCMMQLMSSSTEEDMKDMIIKGQKLYTSQGITTVQDGYTTPADYNLFKFMVKNDALDVDVHSYPPGIEEQRNDVSNGNFGFNYLDKMGNIKFSGFKIVLDGSPQARTAWMTKPYQVVHENDDPNYTAYPFFDNDETVIEGMVYAFKKGAPVLVHCNGDAAGDQFIRCYKEALKLVEPKEDRRCVMIHAQTAREDQLDEMKKLGIIPAMFPIHTYFWGDVHYKNFGEERANKISNMRYAYDIGLLPTAHEDCPVLPPSPLFSLWSAIHRETRSGRILGEECRLTRYEALRSITYNAAYQYFEEDIKGTIEEGKYADFAILDNDILTIDTYNIKDIKVLETIKNGKTIYKRN